MFAEAWIITLTGALLALAALILLAWSLLSDRLRTRPLRRAGTLRRCPKCWYDMRGIAGLQCPECGRTARRERSLTRSRRHWRWAIVAMLTLALGAGTIAYPHGKGGVWHRWVPDTALILLVPYTTDTDWAAVEMARRLGMWGGSPSVSTGEELSARQWRLLTEACARRVARAEVFPPRPLAWWILMCSSPAPEAAFDALLGSLSSDDAKLRLWAALCLDRTRFFLSDSQLNLARDAILASAPQLTEFNEQTRMGHAAAIDRQLASRSNGDPAHAEPGTPQSISPDAIIEAIDGKSINHLIALHRRLGVRRINLLDSDESSVDAVQVERIDLPIDSDDMPDCVLLTYNRYWVMGNAHIYYEAFILLQREHGWRLLGCMDVSNCIEGEPRFSSVAAADGGRWLVVRHDAGSSADGSYFIMQDAWYRVKRGRLVLEQAVMPRAFSSSRFHQTLEPSEPKIIRRSGRYLASYDIESAVGLAVPGEGGSQRLIPIASDRGTFEYPLGVPDTRLGRHTPPGPWGGRDCWWAILDDPALLPEHKDRLLALARSDDPDVIAALRAVIDNYLTFLTPTPELTELQQALDEP